jgi:hypothetical protein
MEPDAGIPQVGGCTHTAQSPHMTELSRNIANAATNPISIVRRGSLSYWQLTAEDIQR